MIKNIKYFLIPMGMYWAYSYSWLTDDIFITFRYIEHLVSGYGLVFNIGEKVEGFTHPLWLFMLVPFYPNVEIASQLLGVLSFGVLIFLLARTGWLAALLVVLSMEMRIWATGGLETMFFTMLVFLSVWATLKNKNWTGWAILSMMLTRPDGIVIAVILLTFVFIENKKQFKRLFYPVLLYLPFLGLRYFYYGDLLPNTYYTKSADGFYFSQGFYYIWVYFLVYVTSFLFLLGFKFIKHREMQLTLAIIFGYLILFVARVGGDFMFARFIIPVVPLIYFVIEYSLKQFKNTAVMVAVVVLVSAEVYLRNDLFYYPNGEHKPAFELKGITNESWYWSHDVGNGYNLIELDKMIGEGLKETFEGKNFVVLLRSQCCLGYYLGTSVTCIDNSGLTDSYIARLPLENRTRVGHDRNAPIEYISKRGVHFLFNRRQLKDYYSDKPEVKSFQAQFYIGEGMAVRGEILLYDSLVQSLFNKKK